MFLSRGWKRGQDKGPEEGSFSKTTQIKTIHLKEIQKTYIFQTKMTFSGHVRTHQHLLRIEHYNGPYGPYEHFLKDISWSQKQTYQVVDGNTMLEKMCNAQQSGNVYALEKKKLRDAPQTENGFQTYSGIFPSQSRPDLIKKHNCQEETDAFNQSGVISDISRFTATQFEQISIIVYFPGP